MYGVILQYSRALRKMLLTKVKIYRVAGDKTDRAVCRESYIHRSASRRGRHKSFIPRTARRVVTRNTSLAIRSISSPSLGPICLTAATSQCETSRSVIDRPQLPSLRSPTTNKTEQSRRAASCRRLSVWKSHPACLFDRELEYRHLRAVCGHCHQCADQLPVRGGLIFIGPSFPGLSVPCLPKATTKSSRNSKIYTKIVHVMRNWEPVLR